MVIEVPVYCAGSIAAEIEPGIFRRIGGECMSASAGIDLPTDFHPFTTVAQNQDVPVSPRDFPTAVSRYMLATFTGRDVHCTYLTIEDSYVQSIIRGLRGRVIQGGRYWERVQISFARLQSKDKEHIRVLADGMLATGVGEYPPDSQFTRAMEPEYSAALTEYTAQIANGFRDFLMHWREQ
jgi:hypothetical protein